jgi:uncharacterized protein (DUF433 family)
MAKAKPGTRGRASARGKRGEQAVREETSVKRDDLLARISIDPNICFGKPCIKGHRIWVSLILDFLAGGLSKDELLQEYPQLEPADIDACIAYGAEMARERFVEIPLERKV